MDRMDEYRTLMEEMSTPAPERLETTLDRALARRRKKRLRPLQLSLTAAVCFVLLVNFCAPVASACSQLPILRELADFVTFSQSLTEAVENEYAQILDLEQTENGLTASVDYLIVDRKQVNLFYRVDGPAEEYYVDCSIEGVGGGFVSGSSPVSASGELSTLQLDFVDREVPEKLIMNMEVRAQLTGQEELEAREQAPQDIWSSEEPERKLLARFRFEVSFDPAYMAPTRTIHPQAAFQLEEENFLLDLVEIYPTGIRFHIQAHEENTVWLAGLDYHLETEDGQRLDSVTNGLSAAGEENSPAMVNYYADSSYFYDSRQLRLVITGVELREKESELISLDESTGLLSRPLPEDITLTGTERQGDSLSVTFFVPHDRTTASVIDGYRDGEGEQIERNGIATSHRWEDGGYDEIHYLPNCPEGPIYLELRYDRYLETEIVLNLSE
ncbi:MAG: DUF4179 domain-containing protein [Oscillospiraceae bacterium]|nr:DUF4179 domain-containing protein [Oscillospiraceae bacterium]